MSSGDGVRKRVAMSQGSRDGDGAEEEFVTTPQIATAEQMAQRRIVTVRRNPPVSAGAPATAAAPTPAVDAKAADAAKVPSPFGSVLGSFSSIRPSNEATGAKGFSFGGFGAVAKPAETPASSTPSTEQPKPAPLSFSFGAPAAAAPAKPAAPAAPMSFSFGAPAAAPAAATDAKPAFSFGNSGSFNFGAAVSNFAAARQQQAQQTAANDDDGDEDPEKEETIDSSRAKLAAVDSVTGEEGERTEVEATAKLQVLNPSDKQWHDRGAGPLKLNVRVNDAGDAELVRFVMRDAKMKKALLNVNVQPVAFRFGQRGEKFFTFIAMEDATKISTYLVRLQGTSAADQTKTILSICDKFLQPKKE